MSKHTLHLIHLGKREGVLLAGLRRVDTGYLIDVRQLLQDGLYTHIHPCLCQPAAQERAQCQRQNTVKSMHANLLVCPVLHGAPPDEMGILHIPEIPLDTSLAAVCQHNLLGTPLIPIGEKDVLAKMLLYISFLSLMVDLILQADAPVLFGDLPLYDPVQGIAQDLSHLGFYSCNRGLFASRLPPGIAFVKAPF